MAIYNNFWTKISGIDQYVNTDDLVRSIEYLLVGFFILSLLYFYKSKNKNILIVGIISLLLYIGLTRRKYEMVNYIMEGNGYRFGDMILKERFKNQINGKNFHLKIYPDSIISKYFKRTDKFQDLEVLNEIVSETKIEKYPEEKDLVIHLRTGDELNKSVPWSVDYFLSEENKDHPYIKNMKYFQSIQIPENIEKIILVTNVYGGGDTRSTDDFSRSYEYIEKIKGYFEETKIVETRINMKADDDFVFMASSKYFTPSGGGFSELVEKIVKIRDNKILLPSPEKNSKIKMSD